MLYNSLCDPDVFVNHWNMSMDNIHQEFVQKVAEMYVVLDEYED